MCYGKCARCLGITLIPLALLCIIANTLLFFPNGETGYNTPEKLADSVWCFSGILGSGLLMVFPVLVFMGMENNDCCGCCGNENCGKRFANFSSVIFAGVGAAGAAYCFIVSAVGLNHGPKCTTKNNSNYSYPFTDGNYLGNHTMWEECIEPPKIVPWHVTLFSLLLVMSGAQLVLCAFQVVNGLIGFLCGECSCCSSCESGPPQLRNTRRTYSAYMNECLGDWRDGFVGCCRAAVMFCLFVATFPTCGLSGFTESSQEWKPATTWEGPVLQKRV